MRRVLAAGVWLGLVGAFFALAAPGHAQPAPSVTAVMTASATSIPVGGTFRLEINIDATGGDAPDPELPDLSAFEVLSRQVFRPTSIRMGWGTSSTVVTSSVRVTFVLRATREGAVSITPARARVGGREFRSNPLTIAVTAAGTAPIVGAPVPPGTPPGVPPGTPPAASAEPPTGVLDGAVYDDQVFLRTVVDRADAYVGEQVTCTVYVYARSRLTSEPPLTREPSTDGFWTFNLRARDRPIQQTTQMIGGMAFQVYAVRRFAAFPIAAGEATIGAPTTVISRASPIDIFMGTPQPDIERTGVPITIRVRDLPTDGRPSATRTSHVGTLNLEATLDRTQVPTGDAVTLTLTASGTGQIDALNFGSLTLDGVRVLSPQTDGEVAASADRVGGTRRIQWLLVPEREGNFSIPSFRVAVFDPRSATWSVAETAPLTLMAAGNPVGGSVAAPDEPPPADEIAPVELGPVRTTSALSRRSPRVASTAAFPWTAAAMPLALGLLVLGRALRRRRGRATAGGPQRGAKEARKRLDAAAAAVSSGDARAFYAAVILALKSVVEGKLGESVGSLTHPQLKQRLIDRGMSEALSKSVVDELESSEYARFSTSGGEPKEMEACLARARNVLGELERFTPTSEDDA